MSYTAVPAELIFILGAGPAGLAAAYTFCQKQQSIQVVEREGRVGGLAKSIDYEGFILDYGPHFFITDLELVLELWDCVLGAEQVMLKRHTSVSWRRTRFDYPPRLLQVLQRLGPAELLSIGVSYLQAQFHRNRKPAKNLEEQLTARFGARLFEDFFKHYIEKLWGRPASEMDAEWSPGRIHASSILTLARKLGRSRDGHFRFPKLGSRQLYERIAELVRSKGQQVLLNTEVVRLHHNDNRITQVVVRDRQSDSEKTHNCRGVVSSIPLPILLRALSPPPPPGIISAAASLVFRNTVLVYLIVDIERLFDSQCIYVNEPEVGVGRVTNFANWSRYMLSPNGRTPLCCEYWCGSGDPIWSSTDSDLKMLAEEELRKISILQDEPVLGGFVVRLARTHPAFCGAYKETVSEVQRYLRRFENMEIIGRSGAFKYYDQDNVLIMGIVAANRILAAQIV
jgi:protoporphyrinogen oxidase